jgi:hypothetical protein
MAQALEHAAKAAAVGAKIVAIDQHRDPVPAGDVPTGMVSIRIDRTLQPELDAWSGHFNLAPDAASVSRRLDRDDFGLNQSKIINVIDS